MPSGNRWLIDDGIIVWFNGPEWDEVALEVFKDAEDELADAARGNAPWADRTGDARSGLTAMALDDHGDVVLTLFHTVEYGLWLEVIQNGQFATIMPTIEALAPEILNNAVKRISDARQGENF